MILLFSSQTKNNNIDSIVNAFILLVSYTCNQWLSFEPMTLPPWHLQWEELPIELEFIGDGIVEAGKTIIYKYDGQNTQSHIQATNSGKPK